VNATFVRAAIASRSTKIFQPVSDRPHHFFYQGVRSLPMTDGNALELSERPDQRVAPVCDVESESLGLEYRCTPRSPAFPSRKGNRGASKQKNSASLASAVTGNPETFAVTTNEECWDSLFDEAGIGRLKSGGDLWGFSSRQDSGAFAFRRDCPGEAVGPTPQMSRVHWLHGDHCGARY
jgi:hypothetical protein